MTSNDRYSQYEASCIGCGLQFTAFKKGAKYCTPTCGQAHRRKTKRLAEQLRPEILTSEEQQYTEVLKRQQEYVQWITKGFTDLFADIAYVKNNPDNLEGEDLAWWHLTVLTDMENLKSSVSALGSLLEGMDLLYLNIMAIGNYNAEQLRSQISKHAPDLLFESDMEEDESDED